MTFTFSLLSAITSNVEIILLSITIPLIFLNTNNKKDKEQSSKKEKEASDKEREYEKKLEDYIHGVDEEVVFTKKKSKSIYNRIIAKIYNHRSYPKGNRLSKLVGEAVRIFSRKRYNYQLFKKKKKIQWFYYNFTNRDFYRLFIDKIVTPVDKKKLTKGDITLDSVLYRRKKYSNLLTLINEQIGSNKKINNTKNKQQKIQINDNTNFRYIHMYRNLYLPYLKRIYDRVFAWPTQKTHSYLKYLPDGSFFFQGISYNSKLGVPFFFPNRLYKLAAMYNFPNSHIVKRNFMEKNFEVDMIGKSMWQSLYKSGLKDPNVTSFKGNRWYFKKKTKVWMHTLHYLYTLNRIEFYKQKQIRQRSRSIASIRQMIKGRKKRKIRASAKLHRLSPYIYFNHYLSNYFNIHKKTLFKTIEMNYNKYPFYKSSIRYFSHDFSSIFKKYAKRQRGHFMSSKNFLTGNKLFQKTTYFTDVSTTKAKGKHKFPGERIVHKVEARRRSFFGSQPKFRRQVSLLISKWLSNSNYKKELKENYTISNRWAKSRLDLSMVTYALVNPNEFEKLFKKELNYMKKKKKKHFKFLIKDAFGIQRIGSAFFFFLGYFNPIQMRNLPYSSQRDFNQYERQKEGYLPNKEMNRKSSPSRRVRKQPLSKRRKIRFKHKSKKMRNSKSMKSIYNYKGFSLWNHVNLYNSFIKAYMASKLSKFDMSVRNSKKTPFTVFYDTLSKRAMHFRTLYSYLFKTEQYRPYKNAISHITKRNSKMYKLIQTPRKKYTGSKKSRYISLKRKYKFKYTHDVYSTFKRYLKLKLQNKLPKGINTLSDWYSYVDALVSSTKKGNTISPRFFYLPFHMKPFLIRNKFRINKTKKGIKGIRYVNLLTRSKSYYRYLKRKYRGLHPKNKSITRASKASLRPNQTRYSLLHNYYLLIKELVAKQIETRSNHTLYQSINYLVRPIMTRLFTLPQKILITSGLIKIQSNFKDYATSIFTSSIYLFFSSHLLVFLTRYVSFKLLPYVVNVFSKVLHHFSNLFASIYINALLLVLINYYFIFTLPGIYSFLRYLAKFKEIILNDYTKSVYIKIISNVNSAIVTLGIYSFIVLKLIFTYFLKINTLIVKCVAFLSSMSYIPFVFLFKDMFFFISYVGSLLQKIFFFLLARNLFLLSPIFNTYISLYKIIQHIKTFIVNCKFNNYLLECYEYIYFKTNKASWVEYRLMAFFYIILSKFKPRGYRYYFLLNVFSLPNRGVERTVSELMIDVEHFFVGYFARVFHWMIRPNILFERVMEICYNFIWSAFFGNWALNGYIHRFRILYLKNIDEYIVTALTYILVSPVLATNFFFRVKPWTYRFFYREIILNLFVATGYLIGVPVYYIYELVWRSKRFGIDQAFVSLFMYIYNLSIFLFIYSHQFLHTLYLMFPSYKVVLYEFLLSFEPVRLIRGLDYTINFHEEILTTYMTVLYSLFGLIYTYIFFARIPQFFFTIYRALLLNLKSTARPYMGGNPNIDLSMYSFLPLTIEMKYLKYIYKNLKKKHYYYFSTERILWFMKKKPSYYKLYYSNLFSTFNNYYFLFHMRKHSNSLYKWGDKSSTIVQLRTKWFPHTYPLDKSFNWWNQHENLKQKYGYKVIDYYKYFDNLERLQELYPNKRPNIRSRKKYILRITESGHKRRKHADYWNVEEFLKQFSLDKVRSSYLKDQLMSNNLISKMPDIVKIYLQKPLSSQNPVYKISRIYQVIQNISRKISAVVMFLVESFTIIYLFNLFLIYNILSFIVYALIPPFILNYLRNNYVSFLSAEYWIDVNIKKNKKELYYLSTWIKYFLTDILSQILLYFLSLPWKLLKLFFYLSNILFILYSDISDLYDYAKKTLIPFVFTSKITNKKLYQRKYFEKSSLSYQFTIRVILYLYHLINLYAKIINYRLSKKGTHPLYEEQKYWKVELTQEHIFDFKKKPSNLTSSLPYKDNYDKRKNYLEGISEQDYITLDELENDKEV